MQRRTSIVPVFLLFLVLAIVIFSFSQKGVWGIFEQILLPVQSITYNVFHISGGQTEIQQLREENAVLRVQLSKQKELEKENKALHDQFQLTNPSPKQLLPAQIIGRGNEELILDKGAHDNVKNGQVVVLKDNIVGIVVKTSTFRSIVRLVTHARTSFTAKTTKTNALGVIYGAGGEGIVLGNVVLAESLEKDDLVVTRGDVNGEGAGFPPDLVVGKITNVNKKASNLFQAAEVKSLINFERLDKVFVLVEN